MVEFDTLEGTKQNYVGQIHEINQNEFTCKFLRKTIKMSEFYCFSFIIDEATIKCIQIICKITILQEKRENYKFQ